MLPYRPPSRLFAHRFNSTRLTAESALIYDNVVTRFPMFNNPFVFRSVPTASVDSAGTRVI
jgi:hypothetical protein